MFRSIVRTFPILFLLAACSEAVELEGPQLLTPERVEFYWDQSFNAYDDALGSLVPLDLMVYDGLSGEALRGVPLAISIAGGEGLILDPGSIGFVDVEECVDCDHFWDSYKDQYFVLTAGSAPESEASLETDATGLARVYVYVDSVESSFEGLSQLDVRIEMGNQLQHVSLVAE